MNALDELHIINLKGENVLRLHAVDLRDLAPGVVEVSGRNRQGKTSLISVIEMCLFGKDSIPWDPIHGGEQSGLASVDLGGPDGVVKLRVTRTFKAVKDPEPGADRYTTKLKVELSDGSSPKGVQTLLNSLVSAKTFDPMSFTEAEDKERGEILRGLVPDFDFGEAERRRQGAYAKRTDVNREAARLRTQADSIEVPADLPETAPDLGTLTKRLAGVAEQRGVYERRTAERAEYARQIETLERDAARLRETAAQCLADADAIALDIKAREEAMAKWDPLQEPEDTRAIQMEIEAARRIEGALMKRTAKAASIKDAIALESEAEELTMRIERVDEEVKAAVAGADMPAGLTIEDGRVLLSGVPFDQGSTAEKIRASVAIGMRLNPHVKVMRVDNGSSLDDQAWDLLCEIAEAAGYQIWVETVRPIGGPAAIIIEDGRVKK